MARARDTRAAEREKEMKLAERMMTREQREATAARVANLEREAKERRKALVVSKLENPEAALIEAMEEHLEAARKNLDEFKADFEKNPYDALRWTQDAVFDAAVAACQYGWMKEFLERPDKPSERPLAPKVVRLVEWIEEKAKETGYQRVRSSSVTSNLVEEAERVFWNRLANDRWSGSLRVRPLYCGLREFADRVVAYQAGRWDEATKDVL